MKSEMNGKKLLCTGWLAAEVEEVSLTYGAIRSLLEYCSRRRNPRVFKKNPDQLAYLFWLDLPVKVPS